MAGRYWDVYAKPIQDKLVDLVKARAEADGLDVGDITAGLGGQGYRYAGIHVLIPSWRPHPGTPTESLEGDFTFPVLCRCEQFTEGDYTEKLGQLVGAVVDAVEANAAFSVTAQGGEVATVEVATVAEVEGVGLVEARGDLPGHAVQVVQVQCRLVRVP